MEASAARFRFGGGGGICTAPLCGCAERFGARAPADMDVRAIEAWLSLTRTICERSWKLEEQSEGLGKTERM